MRHEPAWLAIRPTRSVISTKNMSSYSTRGRTQSPRPLNGSDIDMGNENTHNKEDTKVIIATNLTRNIEEFHLKMVFGVFGEIRKIDLPLFSHCGSYRNVLEALKKFFCSWSE